MHIKSLRILDGLSTVDFRFSPRTTLITSRGANSVGKTSLIRLILHSLGESIPSMQGFSFKNLVTRLELESESGESVVLIRERKFLRAIAGESEKRYALPYDIEPVRAIVFGDGASRIGDNLLGCCYIDQDKGWTLLNRGKSIGDIHFSIESFIRGLSGMDESPTKQDLAKTERLINKFELASNVVGYKRSLGLDAVSQGREDNASKAEERKLAFMAKRNALARDLRSIRRAQKDNASFKEYVDGMKLRVRLRDGSMVQLTSENLAGFNDNGRYLDARAAAIRADIANLDEQIANLAPANQNDVLFNLGEDADSFDRQIAGLNLDGDSYRPIIDSLKERRKELNARLNTPAGEGERILDAITIIARKYCDALGVADYLDQDPKGILTRSLKDKSGTSYHLLVFAFRLAYAKSVEQELRINLPLIIDSPRGREMSKENFQKCMSLLENEFSNHQVIVASISSESIDFDEEILIKDRLMSSSEMIPDFDFLEWECCKDSVWLASMKA